MQRPAGSSTSDPDTPATIEGRIAWVLDHPHMSEWLKQALRSAEGLDPITLRNDLEILSHLIMHRAQAFWR